ncbi:MAG: hypothetical protein ABIE42_08435 [Candidatus Eisenbacteria bacterium]
MKCIHVDEPADLLAAERLFARLCARALWAERMGEQGSKERTLLPEEDE